LVEYRNAIVYIYYKILERNHSSINVGGIMQERVFFSVV
jgi:hypothetical protein